jgi:hypothetical protein
MDIHKPKPWHSVREFLKEYAIIVVGVLTALAAEQIVERVHERQVAAEARENIRRELADDFVTFDKRRAVQACIARRLDDMDALLRTAGAPGYKPPSWIGRPQTWNLLTARWEAASQAGRTSLFAVDEQARYSVIYTSFRAARAAEDEEQKAWAQLRALEGDPAPTAALVSVLKLALQEARFQDWNVRISLGQAGDAAAALHLPAGHTNLAGSRSACLPMQTSRAEAARLLKPRWVEP